MKQLLPRVAVLLCSFPWVGVAGARAEEVRPATSTIDFRRDIKPILTNNCYSCHGPDHEQRRAGLRLDQRADALRRLKSGNVAIVPGDSARSDLLLRVSTEDDGRRMPPKKSDKKLTRAQIDLLRRWIDGGAKWEDHWAFVKPARPPLPEVKDAAWCRNATDYFILARLEKNGLHPSPEADRTTLIRRLTFDLTGLPPTLAEIDAFLNDRSPEAYEKVVDRLLASPHYGEKMAIHWLDLARYADTNGYHIDNHRDMWKYREWVINAFNRNEPFDQFTIEQFAGDLLPNATLEQKIATGFHRNVMVNFEGGADPDEYLTKYIGDRVTTTATVWLGLTMACCECHDHKYDPLTQKEYYQLYAFFNNVPEKGLDGQKTDPVPSIRVPSPEESRRLADLRNEIARLEAQLQAPEMRTDAEQTAWEQKLRAKVTADRAEYQRYAAPLATNWHVLGPFPAANPAAALTTAFGPEKDFDLARTYENGKLQWHERAAWLDGAVHTETTGPGAVYLFRTLYSAKERPLVLTLGSKNGVQVWLNGQQVFMSNAPRGAALDQDRIKVVLKTGDNRLLVKLTSDGSYAFACAATAEPPLDHPRHLVDLVLLPAEKRKDQEKAELRTYYREKLSPMFLSFRVRLDVLRKAETDLLATLPETMVMEEKPNLRETHVLMRGSFQAKGERVTANVPVVLPPLPSGQPGNRLTLARWLVLPDQPLTARVAMNRYWQMFFGTGLVKTANDFGTQGELPSHPELLDWLATEFSGHGWNVKAMHKLIVMSATYRQSAKVTPRLLEVDPANRLLARAPRFRLSAEMIRDNALAISGLLDERVGGRSVYPYQPAGLWEAIAFGGGFSSQTYIQSHGHDLYRRAMYTYWKRSLPYPSLAAFDAPNREVCTVVRPLTNTPLQALVLLNDPAYVEAARVLAQRIVKEGGPSPLQRLVFAFRLCTAREPTSRERELLFQVYQRQLERYQKDPAAALQLVSTGESARPPELNVSELAAWTTISNVLLNLDETMTKG